MIIYPILQEQYSLWADYIYVNFNSQNKEDIKKFERIRKRYNQPYPYVIII
jgi:hypothetical protein